MHSIDPTVELAETPKLLGAVFLKYLLLEERRLDACDSDVTCGP